MKCRLLLALSILCTLGYAQQQNSDSLWNVLVPQKKRPFVFARGSIGAQSSSTSTNDILKVLGDDFLNNEEKEKLIPAHGSMRMGYVRNFEVGYRQPAYRIFDVYQTGQGFSYANTYYSTASLSNDMTRLILFGNRASAGETLNLDGSHIESWYYSNLKYHFDVVIDSTQPISFTAGIVLGHDHAMYNLRKARLYTEPDGEYLDVDLDYRYRENLNPSVLTGLGIAVSAEADFKTGARSVLHIKLNDLGLINFTQARSLETDSSFRFRGVDVDNIFELNDSLLSQVEDDFTKAYYYQRQGSITRLMPFSIAADYQWITSKAWMPRMFASAHYLYLPGYYPKLSVGGMLQPGRDHRIRISLSGGGFYVAGLDAAWQWEISRYWQLNLGVVNLSGLVIPSLPGGAIFSGGLRYEL